MYTKRENAYHCAFCNFMTININTVRSHVQSHKEIRCGICGASFTRSSALIVHRKSCRTNEGGSYTPIFPVANPPMNYFPYPPATYLNYSGPQVQAPFFTNNPFNNGQAPCLSGYTQFPIIPPFNTGVTPPNDFQVSTKSHVITEETSPSLLQFNTPIIDQKTESSPLHDAEQNISAHEVDHSDFYDMISKVKAGKQEKLHILLEKSKVHHNNFDMEHYIPAFLRNLQSLEHAQDDHFFSSIEKVKSMMIKLNHKHFVGVNPSRWYNKFPVLRYIIHVKYDRFVEKNKVSKEDFESGKIGRDKRYQEVHQIQSCLSVFIMIVLMLNDYNSLDSFNECDIFNLSYLLFFLKLYEGTRELKTTRRQKEQIFWIFKRIFLMIQQSLYFLKMKETELRFLERIKLRIESYKQMLTDKYPHIDKFNPKLYPELVAKGSMITYNEEIAITMWLIKNLDNIVDIWEKFDKDQIPNLKITEMKKKKSNNFSKKLYEELLRDSQVIIGSILLLYLYGQRSQISNSLTVNSVFYQDSVGLVLLPMQEKIRRKSAGIPLNNDLLPVLHYQIHVIRKRCFSKSGVKAMFLKSNGTPYNSGYWSKLLTNLIKMFNPDISVTGSASFRRGLFSFNQFNETKEINLVRQLYNVRSSTGFRLNP